MGIVFKRTRRAGHKSRRWYIRYTDANGREHTEAAYTDKGESRRLLGERETAALEGRLESGAAWKRWARLPLHSPHPEADTHLRAYLAHLEAKGTGEGQRTRVAQHLRAAFAAMPAAVHPEITQAAVERHLVELLRAGRAAATRNHRLSALRSFWRWGTQAKRFPTGTDPTLGLALLKAEAARVRPRRALSEAELRALLAAARARPLENYLAAHGGTAPAAKCAELEALGLQRATLYATAALAGLRRRELLLLRWGDVRLEAPTPHLVVRAAHAKASREEVVELAPALAAYLRDWRTLQTRRYWRNVGSTEPVFDCVSHGLLAALWADCAFARVERLGADGRPEWRPIPITTADGRVDVHALRHTCATLLCTAGVPVAIAQRILRHRDPRTTLRVYAHVGDSDRMGALNRLPRLDLEPAPAARATGSTR